MSELPRGLSEPSFDPNALRVLNERYFARKGDGSVETPREFLWRVASAVAQPERPYASRAGKDAEAQVDGVAHAFYDMLARRDFMPNTPCLVNAGRPLSMLSACFVLPVPDSIEGIFYNLQAMALIQKAGGGTGYAFSELRPNGALVESTGKDASGPVSFMKVFNAATDSIKQGGVRRGANMGVLRVDHPDVFHFMRCKKELDSENRALYNRMSDTGKYTEAQLAHIKQELLQTQMNNFNVSIGVTDAFMDAVELDADFDLVHPKSKEVVRTVKAREIWDGIVEGAWQNGEPGVLFLDHPEWNPLPGLGPIQATNPCLTGETVIETSDGPRKIADLVEVQFEAIVDGVAYPSSNVGAWSNGQKPVSRLTTEDGHVIRATIDHKFLRAGSGSRETGFVPLALLKPGDRLALHTHARVAVGAGGVSGNEYSTTVASIVPDGIAEVYDVNIPGPHAVDASGGIYVRNCGEQALHGYDSCNLGSINVGHFYDDSKKDVDWDRLAQAVSLGIRFLDNVIDANIYPLEEIREMVTNNRRVGLGIMGYADLLIQMRIAYGSPDAVDFAAKLMKFIRVKAEDTSEILARERGDFPNKHLSVYANDPRPRRNVALLSIAPTGTISMIAGCSFGCEPYFGMAYTKHVMKDAEGRPQHLYYVIPLFEEIAKDEGFFSDELLAAIEGNRGSVKGLAQVPKLWQDVFTVAADVSVDEHIDMLAAFQKYTCNAVSKCVAEGTLIPTDHGLIPIERMGHAAEGTFGELNDTYHVISHDGSRRRVTGFYNNGRVKTVRIRTKNGATLEASETHHVLTINGWKAMLDLQIGDLIVGRFEEISGAGGAPIDTQPYPLRNTANPIVLPKTMSPELALWLGMIAADGHTVESSGNVGLSEKDESGDIARAFDGLCERIFGQSPHVVIDKRTGVRNRYLTSRALARYVASLIGSGAANKRVPTQILQGSAQEKIAFVNGVSLDGHVAHDAHRNHLVVYAGISGALADGLEAVCRSLGLPACYRWTERKADGYLVHQVRVSAELQRLIDPVESRKKVASVNPQRLVRVPDEVFALSLRYDHSEFSNLRSLKERQPQHCFASTLEKLQIPLADPKEYLVKVASIETSEAQTYDIEVEESHSYVVNGLVSHNTINAPNDDTRENVAKAIFRAYKSGCKGFTYYRDGSRTEQVVTFSKDADIAGVNRDKDGAKPVASPAVDAAAAIVKDASEADPLEALLARADALLGN